MTHKPLFFLSKLALKMDLTALFTHLKIILLQYFQFLIVNFQQNKQYPNTSIVYVCVWIAFLVLRLRFPFHFFIIE